MERLFKLLLVFLLMVSSGCGLLKTMSLSDIIHASTTVTEKKPADHNEANAFLKSASIDTLNSFQLSCSYVDSFYSENYALNKSMAKRNTESVIQIRMYNKYGSLVSGWEQCVGNLKKYRKLGFFDSLPMKQFNKLPFNYDLNLSNDINLYDVDAIQKKKLIEQIGNYDYTIAVFYTNYTGWFSKDALKQTKKYIKKNKSSSIQFLKLNVSPLCN